MRKEDGVPGREQPSKGDESVVEEELDDSATTSSTRGSRFEDTVDARRRLPVILLCDLLLVVSEMTGSGNPDKQDDEKGRELSEGIFRAIRVEIDACSGPEWNVLGPA